MVAFSYTDNNGNLELEKCVLKQSPIFFLIESVKVFL